MSDEKNEMPALKLDALDSVEVKPGEYANEVRTLKMLTVGLRQLYGMVKARELAYERRSDGKYTVVMAGLDYDGSRDKLPMIGCFFHWFGVSVCNYARLVGFVRAMVRGQITRTHLGDPGKCRDVSSAVKTYVSAVPELADVFLWRNKVAGHFAITDPRPEDNAATLDMSVIFPVTFESGRYVVGGLTMIRGDASGSHASAIPSWSVTRVFESLAPRYWPGLTFKVPPAGDAREH